tara:strand:+ start:186 stop:1334 length:1149 start_codon:yes stop_codon:yes gene_type:complete
MKILIGSNVNWWNAEAEYAAKIAQLLLQVGHKVFILTRPDTLNSQKLNSLGLPLVENINLNSKNPFQLFISYQKLKKFIDDEQIDLINPHRSEGFPLFVFAAFAARSKKPEKPIAIVRTRGTTRILRNHWLNRKMNTDWTDYHITAGEIISQRLMSTVPRINNKIKTIYFPADCSKFPNKLEKNFYEEFEIPENHRVISVVGRIRPVKGQRVLLKVFNELLSEFTDLILLIPYRDTSEKEDEMIALREDLNRLNLKDNVRLIPEREDILQIMEFTSLGIVSSIDSEVICRVAMEFFSVGTPVVAFPTGCLPEIIRHRQNGMLAKNKTLEALLIEIRNVLSNPKLLDRISQGALKDAEVRFDPKIMLDKTLEVFRSALSSCRQ